MKIPSYEEALKITEESEAFYVQRGKVKGYEYAMFNYRLATCEDFLKHNALELRGLTFIKNDMGEWVRYPMLRKFFNLNQCECTQYNKLKNKEIDSVEYKEDGSLISLITLPNGEIVSKTKMSFDNEQTNLVSKMCLTSKVKKIVSENTDLYFLFELVSPKNKIVLKYNTTELRLLQIRDSEGNYLPVSEVKKYAENMDLNAPITFAYTLDELLKKKENAEGLEGWVVKFKDGQFIKIKTDWYLAAHGLREDMNREHKIIEMIMDETIDDILGELENGSEEKAELLEIIGLIDKYYNHRVEKALNLREKYFNEFNENRKEFAIAYSKTKDFGVVMKNLKGNGIPDAIKERIKFENSSLEKARDFIESLRKEQK